MEKVRFIANREDLNEMGVTNHCISIGILNGDITAIEPGLFLVNIKIPKSNSEYPLFKRKKDLPEVK